MDPPGNNTEVKEIKLCVCEKHRHGSRREIQDLFTVCNFLADSLASFTGKFFSTQVWEEPGNEAAHLAILFDYKYGITYSL